MAELQCLCYWLAQKDKTQERMREKTSYFRMKLRCQVMATG